MIGLGTYAFFWQHSASVPEPLSLVEAFEATKDLGVDLFQICDYAPLEHMTTAELADASAAARSLGLTVELGTKGVEPEHLIKFLRLAEIFDASLLRSMVFGAGPRPTLAEVEVWLERTLPSFQSAGVTLALETYEQISVSDLVNLVAHVGNANLGICLDPANVVARLENPREAVEVTSDYVVNVHAKDFAFSRQPGWVGFTYSGAPLGEGLHDYKHLFDTVKPRERAINEVVEHWLPWQGTPEDTILAEQNWTQRAVDFLKSAA